MLTDSSMEEDANTWHDLFYDGHEPTTMCEPLSSLAKYMAEKSLSKDVLGQQTKPGNFFIYMVITINNYNNLGDSWVVRTHVDIGNVFDPRPGSTYFGIGATVVKYDDTWGEDTFGNMRDANYANFGAEGAFTWFDKLHYLRELFDQKLEVRFPRIRSRGSCISSRIGNSIF